MSPRVHVMMAVLTSLLLVILITSSGHVLGDTSPRPRCPVECHCNGSDVSCSDSYITDIPQFPVNTGIITIKGNNITRIRANAFSELYKLKAIYIQLNNIRSIDERAFEGLDLLMTMSLLEKSLSSFETGVFRFFPKMTVLSLRAKLIEVPQGEICLLKQLQRLTLGMFLFPSVKFDRCFEDLIKLRMLKLYGMKLGDISRATFHPFRAYLAELHLNKCGLRRLDVDTFNNFSKLTVLSLCDNAITSLPNSIFTPLTRLTNLNIAKNKLKAISSELLRPLRHLKYLFIGDNSRVNMTFGEEFLNMTRLRQIILKGIKLKSLNNDTFRNLRHCPLEYVDMSKCSIRTISNGAFLPLHNLTSLSLDLNPLNGTVLHYAFYGLQGSTLRKLRLSNVNLHDSSTTLFEGLNDNNIATLLLTGSQITTIKRGVFRNLRKVSRLYLGNNEIQKIEDHSFEDLVRLSQLNIDRNRLVELHSAKRIGVSQGLSWLSMRQNLITRINDESLVGYDNLTILTISGNNIRTISANAFASTPRLKVLNLSENKIRYIRSGTFDMLQDLEYLSLKRNAIQIDDPSLFQRMYGLKILDISENSYFGRHLPTFRSVFQNLHSLKSINLYGCGINTLPVGMFINTTQLENLDLISNAIKSWNPDVFAPLRNLRKLTLSQNQIVSVNVASFSQLPSLYQIALMLNPFACNCDLMWFLEYVQNNIIHVMDIGHGSAYTCASPESLHGVPILRAGLSPADCVSHTDLIVTLSTAAAIALLAIVFTLVYRGRWYIRYYVFLIRSRRRRYFDLAEGSYVYDAFVAHNSNDASWVVRHLLPRLEAEGRYRLCLHQRDWPIGREISENIVESIEASRKVIVVLSNNFAQSQWCRMELEMANHRRLSNWRNSLVLVLLETISPENQTATLRSLLTTHTYLEWNERAEEKFWRALRKELRPPPRAPPIQMRSVQGGIRLSGRETERGGVGDGGVEGDEQTGM